MFEFDVAAGAKVPAAHSHDGFDETCYMLKGRLSFTVGGEAGERGQGEVLFIPRGVVHRFDNVSGEDATALAVITPGAGIRGSWGRSSFARLRRWRRLRRVGLLI